MVAYIVRRTLMAAFTVLIISFLSYWIAQLPEGDAVDAYLERIHGAGGEGPGRTLQEMEALRDMWGLNRPLVVQYWDWITTVIFEGDFGYSYIRLDASVKYGGGPIAKVIKDRLPYTIYLAVFTIALTWMFAIPVGIYSAVRQHSLGDYTFTLLGFTGLAVPDFLLGLVMMYVFFAYFDQSVGGLYSADYATAPMSVDKVIDLLKHLIIPGVVLGTAGDRRAYPHNAQQPAGRAAKTLRDHCKG